MFGRKPNEGQRKSLLTGASLLAATAAIVGGAAPAQAQDEEIVVTGSRIPQANLFTTSPVTQVTAEDIQTQGVTRLEDLTNELPQVFASQGSNYTNGADGTANVDLRGLGAQRTLVLIDGRRMGYGSPLTSAADLNQIPGVVVERVEVLTGGASAVYGSDAVAGVVNFITNQDFEGFRFDAQYGFYQHNNDYDGPGGLRDVIAGRSATNPSQFALPPDDVMNGYGREVSVMFGASTADGRGNVTAYAGYRNNDAILQKDFDYSSCSINPGSPAIGTNFACGGSGTNATGQFTDFSTFAFTTDQDVGGPGIGQGSFRDYDGTLDQYNFGPLNYYQRPDERYTLGAFAHYEINPHAEVYAQLMHSDYKTDAQIAPSGDFGDTSTINCADSVLLSASQLAAICGGDRIADIVDDITTPEDEVQDYIDAVVDAGGTIGDANADIAASLGDQTCNNLYDDPLNPDDEAQLDSPNDCPLYVLRRNVEGGGRDDNIRTESYRIVTGIRGAVNDGWDYDVSGTFSHVQLTRVNKNYLSISRMRRAIDVIADPDTGDPVCRSVVDGTDPACVPWNIFAPGGVTEDALTYLQVPLMQSGETTQQDVVATLTGTLGQFSPWAETPVAASFGAEYRRDTIDSTADAAWQSADGGGLGGPTLPLSGKTDVFEVFGEARVPLVEGAPLAEQISLDLAYRRSEYTNASTNTYKVGLDWAPTDDVRFRASFQRAVRAANVIELFASQGFNLFDQAYDPCDAGGRAEAGAGPVPTTCFGSEAYQVTVGQSLGGGLNSPAGQYQSLEGGNPDLAPEESDTTTFGVVFTPSFIPNFNLSVDYFDIKVDGLVSTTGSANTLVDCYENANLASCARIERNSVGQLWLGAGRVEDLNTNIGGLTTSGYDINANYSFPIGESTVSFQLIGTLLESLETDPGITGFDPYDCAGSWGSVCGTPNPEWRHRFRVGLETPWDLNLFATWRYVGEVQRVDASNDDVNGSLDSVFDAENYLDLSGNYQLFENTSLRFGVNNVLDNDPPVSGNVGTGGGNGNTFPQVYEATGRWAFAGLTVDF